MAARQFQREIEARQRRTQLVRNVGDQSFLRADQSFQSRGHVVEIASQIAQFIGALNDARIGTRRQIAFRKLIDCRSQLRNRSRDVARQPPAKQARRQQHCQQAESAR